MFFVNVQSSSVHNACYFWIRYCVIQSRFLSTICRHFRVDKFPWFSSLAHSILLESTTTISLLCINHQLKCCNPAVVIFSLHRRFRRCDFEALAYTAAHIVASSFTLSGTTHCCQMAVITIDYRPHQGDSLSRHRAGSQHRHHPHHRLSIHLRAPHLSETHACRSPTTPSCSSFTSVVGSSAPTSRSVASLQRLRAPSPRRAPLHAAHAFIQLRIITRSWAPFSPLHSYRPRPIRQSSSAAIAWLSRARSFANDIKAIV